MSYKIRVILVLIATLVILPTIVTLAQDKSNGKYIRIVHSSEETMAVDSLGEEWYYDDESCEFIRADRYREIRSEKSRWRDIDGEVADRDIVLPPEERCTDVTYGDLSDFLDDIEIGLDQRIEGSVICGKNVIVEGLVTGDVFSFQTVIVASTGEVRGDIIASKIRKKSGGVILGTRNEVPVPHLPGITLKPELGVVPGFVTIFVT